MNIFHLLIIARYSLRFPLYLPNLFYYFFFRLLFMRGDSHPVFRLCYDANRSSPE